MHLDVVYVPAGTVERVFVTALAHEIGAPLRAQMDRLRGAHILDAEGNLIEKTGMLAFDERARFKDRMRA